MRSLTTTAQLHGRGVIRNNCHDIIIAYAGREKGGSIHEAEALALLRGVQTAASWHLQLQHIEGDFAVTIQSFSRGTKCLRSNAYISQAKQLIPQQSRLQLIKREGNSLADSLAKQGQLCTESQQFTAETLPQTARDTWLRDKLQTSIPWHNSNNNSE